MQQWEYLTRVIQRQYIEEQLVSLGRDGWEMAGCYVTGDTTIRGIFKRPLSENHDQFGRPVALKSPPSEEDG